MFDLSCREFAEAYARGDFEGAPPWTRLRAWLHLRLCADCRKFKRQLRMIASAARRGAASKLHPELLAAFKDRVKREFS